MNRKFKINNFYNDKNDIDNATKLVLKIIS